MHRLLPLTILLFACAPHGAVRVEPYAIEAVTFTGAGYRAVELDGYGTAAGPHWPLRSLPPRIAEDVPEWYRLRGAPVAYLAGAVPEIELSARVPRAWSGAVSVEARGERWDFTGTGEATAGVLRARVRADRALPRHVLQDADWRLRWRAAPVGGRWVALGSSRAQLYGLLREPRGPLLHTALHLAAEHAAGATLPEQVVAGVWSAFAAHHVRRARDRRALRYYGEYRDGAPAELRRLLVSGTGQCVAWTHLLQAALGAHGIAAEVFGVYPPEAGRLYLRPWRFHQGTRFVTAGENGVSETDAAGDDVVLIPRGRGMPYGRVWEPEPLPIGRLAGDDTLAYMLGRNGLAESYVDTALALPLLARGFGLEQQRAYELDDTAAIIPAGDDVIVARDGVRLLLTGANGVLETRRQPGIRPGRARGSEWEPVVGHGYSVHRVQGALPRAWPVPAVTGDDTEWRWVVTTGPDGVSQMAGPRRGTGVPHVAVIGAGENGVIDSAPGGDDRLADLAPYLDLAPPGYTLVSGINAWPEPGPAAQQNPWPPAEYPSHALLQVGDRFYDPAYGTGPFASPLAWERASLAGVGVRLVRNGELVRQAGLPLHAIRPADGVTPLTRWRRLPDAQ